MRFLVTGGAGYIGSVVTVQLLKEGHEVMVLDNISKGHRRAVPDGASFVRGDLLDAQRLARVLATGFDGVLHFAALSLVGESARHPERYYRTNVMGTLNLLEGMLLAGISPLVFSSTAAVYGEPEEVPIPETAPTLPTNPYGGSKLAVDNLIGFYAAAHSLQVTSLRYFNVAGASGGFGEDHQPETHLIPLVLEVADERRTSVEIYGTDYPTPDGTAIRDYIHIEDLAQAHLSCAGGGQAGRAQDLQPGERHRLLGQGGGAKRSGGNRTKDQDHRSAQTSRGPGGAGHHESQDPGRARLGAEEAGSGSHGL
jgi:UDP-glucose 4-epimerase